MQNKNIIIDEKKEVKKNIIFLALSLDTPNNINLSNEYQYLDANAEAKYPRFKGQRTNDGPFRCFMHMIEEKKEKLDEIIILCTDLVREGPTKTYDSFKERVISDYKLSDEIIKIIEIADDPNSKEIEDKSIEIAMILPRECSLYIDITGGPRDSMFIFMNILRIVQTKRINIKSVVAAKLPPKDGSNPGTINERINIYNQFNFISGIDEIINFSRTKKLFEYYINNTDQQIQRFKSILGEFEEALLFCDFDSIGRIIEELREGIKEYDINRSTNKKKELFDVLISTIKSEYENLLRDNSNILDIIKFCFEKDYIQPALVFYIELVPTYLFEKKKILKIKEPKIKDPKKLESPEKSLMASLNETLPSEIQEFINNYYYETPQASLEDSLCAEEIMNYVDAIKIIEEKDKPEHGISEERKTNLDSLCKGIKEEVSDVMKTSKKPPPQASQIRKEALKNDEVIRKIFLNFFSIEIPPIKLPEKENFLKNIIKKIDYNKKDEDLILLIVKDYFDIKDLRNNVSHANSSNNNKSGEEFSNKKEFLQDKINKAIEHIANLVEN